MIRDEELNRLIRYAQGMGISVRFKPYVKRSMNVAEWTTDGTEITVYHSPGDSKIGKILSLIHELGHAIDFARNDRAVDPELEEALLADDHDKKDRKKIYLDEVNGAQHWEEIYKYTNCQFNIDKLHKQKELDLWCYKIYYETGKFPSSDNTWKKRKELRKKYRC